MCYWWQSHDHWHPPPTEWWRGVMGFLDTFWAHFGNGYGSVNERFAAYRIFVRSISLVSKKNETWYVDQKVPHNLLRKDHD